MRKNKSQRKILLLIVLLLSIGLGYALLTQDLTINGITRVKGNTWDIHFENVQVSSGSVSLSTGDSAAEIDSNDDTLVNYTVTLNQPGDFYEFTVDAVNEGTVDGMIGSVTSKLNGAAISSTNPLPSYLSYAVTYEDDIEIASNHLLEAGHTETYKVRVEFKRDIENSELPSTDQTNSFSFKVDYLQKSSSAIPRPTLPMIQATQYTYDNQFDEYYCDDTRAFRSDTYRNKIKTITLGEEINPPENIVDSWDIGVQQNGNVMAYLTVNEDDNTMYDLTIQGDGGLYANPDSSYLFGYLNGVDVINNIDVLNVSKVTNMSNMFNSTGHNSTVFTLDLGDNFDTSKVTNMAGMFNSTGYNSTAFTLDLGDEFDTSKITNMNKMFKSTGFSSLVFSLDLGDKFDTSKVTDMKEMFEYAGYKSTVFTLNLGNKFDTSNVTTMVDDRYANSGMFARTGYSSTVFTLDLGDKFDTSKVTSMQGMFCEAGYTSPVFTLNLGNKFDTSKVTSTGYMFNGTGHNSLVFTLDLGNKFDTSNVTNMKEMFYETGYTSPVFTLNLGNKFDTSKVTNVEQMFQYTGHSSLVFTLDLGNKFDTSNITSMRLMFNEVGYSSPIFTISFGDKFDTSNVTNMKSFLYYAGYANNSLELDLSGFDFTNVTSYSGLFGPVKSSTRIWVKDAADQSWLVSHCNLNTNIVRIKGT